jgi:hypothetical protein
MSSFKRKFQNTIKWDDKDNVRDTNSWSQFMTSCAPNRGEKSQITNEAAARSREVEERKSGEREEEEAHAV